MSPNFDELLRQDALTFARQGHYELHQTMLGEEPYLQLLTYDIERIVSGHLRRYICNLPPGHGKTILFSVTQTAWILGQNPSARILIVSYGEDLATDIARKIRTILQARWFRRVFPKTVLAKD